MHTQVKDRTARVSCAVHASTCSPVVSRRLIRQGFDGKYFLPGGIFQFPDDCFLRGDFHHGGNALSAGSLVVPAEKALNYLPPGIN